MPRLPSLALALLVGLLLLPAAAHASPSGIVVSQVYGGGGNTGATHRNDFVELFNAGSAAVDVTGWSVQYATASGTAWQATPLSGSIAPGGYFLVQLASASDTGAVLPTPDATGTSNLSASSGKVALVRDAAALACGASAGSCSADSRVEDLVGYGAATDFEGSGSAPGLSNTAAALRAGDGCVDTDDNAADFAAGSPAPRNSASTAHACDGEPPPPPPGASASASVEIDVEATLAIALDRPVLSFGSFAAGETPDPQPENVTVSSSHASGYSLAVERTAFAPADLPLAISATAPAGGELGAALVGGGLVPIPIGPSAALVVGTTSGPSAPAGDVWPTSIGFSSPIPAVAAGRYTATLTFTAAAR